MRIFLNNGEEEWIEINKRFSKSNHGSRKNYSTESALLEKIIVFDNSLISYKKNVYNLTDLKACYDCQLVNIGALIEELIGLNKNAM